jgi:hypothetical protein
MAQGIIGAMAQSEFAAWDEELVTNDYTLGASRAMDVLTDGLAPEESFMYVMDAYHSQSQAR